jgi:hypothetical protein
MPSLWDDATSPYTQDQQPPQPWSLLGMLHSLIGENAQRGPQEPMVTQDPQTGMAVPYVSPTVPSVSDLAYSATGAKDIQQGYQAAQRGEYLPAIGQGAYGALQAASLLYPAVRGAAAAGPVAREMAEGIPALLQDESGALRLRRGMLPEIPTFDPNAPAQPATGLLSPQLPPLDTPPPAPGGNLPPAPKFSSPGQYGSNPLPIPAEADARLARKLARDPDANIGSPKNDQPIQLPNGVFVGPVNTDQWIARNEKILSPMAIDQSANWYKEALPAYEKYFGQEKAPQMMGAWLIANQNATPGFAQLSATRALEQYVNQTRGMPESLQAGLPDVQLNKYWDAILSKDPSKFADLNTGQKIYDFIDSAAGKTTRTFYGDDPRAGAPAVADVHTSRDTGFIDPTMHDWIRKSFGDDVANQITPDGTSSPSETQYEWSADRMRAITDDLNQRNYRGRSDWTPAEAQAVGWKAMSTMLGRPGQTAETAILSTRRNLSYELDFGKGAPWNEKFPEWQYLSPEEKRTVSDPVVAKAMDFAKDVTGAQENWRLAGTGAWHADLNPAYKSQFLSSPEVVNDVGNILGHQLQQTEVYGSRLIPSGNKWALAMHGDGLDDPANLQAIWAEVQRAHPDLAEGFSPAVDENRVPGIHMFFNGGGKVLGQRIESDLIPTIDAAAQKLGITADARLLRGETHSSKNDWSVDPNGGGHLQRLSTRYGPSVQQRLDDHAQAELEPLIRQGIDKVIAARGSSASPQAPPGGAQTLAPEGALNPNSPGTPPGLLSY